MSNQHLKVRKGINLTPQSTEPTNPVEGAMYFDTVVGLRLRKNGVWQTAGGQGEVKVALVDRAATALPLVAPASIDGETIADGDKILFTNLLVDNNRVYRATVVGLVISWAPQPDFAGQFDPSQADVVRVVKGATYCKSQFIFQGTTWLWGMVDIDNGALGSISEPWSDLFIDDITGKGATFTTDATNGGVEVKGTEKLEVSADGGLDVSGGLTQTKGFPDVLGVSFTDVTQTTNNSTASNTPTTWWGTTFTVNTTGVLKETVLRVQGAAPTSGSLTVDVYETDGTVPVGLPIETSASIPYSSIPAAGNEFTIPFSETTLLQAGTKYFFIPNTSLLVGNLPVNINNSDVYAGGNVVYTSDSGSSWISVATWDLYFKVNLTPITNGSSNLRLNAPTSGYIDLRVPNNVTDYNITLPAAQGTSGQLLSLDNAGDLQWGSPVLGFSSWTVINSNTVVGVFSDLGVETNLNTVDVTLPTTPANGSRVRVIDSLGTFATNSCFIKTVDSSTIIGLAQPLEIDTSYVWAEFVYDSAANNWVVYGPLAEGPGDVGVPLGSIIPIASNLAGTVTIPASGTINASGFMICDGVVIPPEAVVSGSTPQLDDGRFLMGSTAAGIGGGSNTLIDHTHTDTLAAPAHTHPSGTLALNSGTVSGTAAVANHTHTDTFATSGAGAHAHTTNAGNSDVPGTVRLSGSGSGGIGSVDALNPSANHTHTITGSVTGGGAHSAALSASVSTAIAGSTGGASATALTGSIGTGSVPTLTDSRPKFLATVFLVRVQ